MNSYVTMGIVFHFSDDAMVLQTAGITVMKLDALQLPLLQSPLLLFHVNEASYNDLLSSLHHFNSFLIIAPCNSREYQCSDGHCIPDYRRCDSIPDCRDYSDELDCRSKDNSRNTCSYEQFSCVNIRQCVPLTARCDSRTDCLDRSDEEDCKEKN